MNPRSTRGAVLITALMITLFLTAVGLGLLSYTGIIGVSSHTLKRRDAAMLCADSGLQLGKRYFTENYASWGANCTTPCWLSTYPTLYSYSADVDGDGVNDVTISLRDNDDEFPTNDPTKDNDLRAIVSSKCINPKLLIGDQPPVLEAIIRYVPPTGNVNQAGGGSGAHDGNYDGH